MSNVPVPEAIEPEALDIQHDTDPAEDHGPARRVPHIGHAILFFSLATLFILLCQLALFTLAHVHLESTMQHPGLGLASQALAYVLTIAVSAWLFPQIWGLSFLQGIQWNFLAARRYWYWIVAGGIVLSGVAQASLQFIPAPKSDTMDSLMNPHTGWLLMAFAVFLAPLTEELAFRGFLLPALATAYDWLALERTPAGIDKWQRSSMNSGSALA
jgi:membrane protease YdiL (CAAX protease family)